MADSHPLKKFRKEQHLTQDALAKRLGVHANTVSRWEIGERKIDDDMLPKVVELTGIAPAELRPDLERLLRAEGAVG